MKILIVGAGVIGQIYAARLHKAGHEVTVLARHQTLQTLIQDGITLVNEARPDPPIQGVPVRVEMTGEVGPTRSFELALVTVRRDQVDEILPALAGLPARLVVMMQNNSLDLAHVSDIVGHDRTLFAATCASINSCGGDAVKLAADRERVATMIRSAGEGFRALASQGVAVQPRALKMIFTIVPPVIAVLYWQGQLRGTLGTVALAPHSRMTKDTELPVLYRDVQKMVAGMAPTPHLDKLLTLAQLLCLAT